MLTLRKSRAQEVNGAQGGLRRALPREGPGHGEVELFTCVCIFIYINVHLDTYMPYHEVKNNPLKGSSGSLSRA